MAGQTIMSITYGLQVEPGDAYLTTAEHGNSILFAAALSGAFFVDSIPALKYVPDWMPFTSFKRKAKEGKVYALAMLNEPFDATKRNIVSAGSELR